MPHKQPQPCAGSCCKPECPKPVVSCAVVLSEVDPDVLQYEVSDATTAWIIKRCADYLGYSDTRIDITLTGGAATGELEIEEAGCVYTVHASNECGEVSTTCYDPTAYPCSLCPGPPEQYMLGTMYTISGVVDSQSRQIDYYRISDGVHVATAVISRTGYSVANHSGFVAWNLETCCWENMTTVALGPVTYRYELTVHVAHFTGTQTWATPGVYFYQIVADLETFSNLACITTVSADQNFLQIAGGIGSGTVTGTIADNAYSYSGALISAVASGDPIVVKNHLPLMSPPNAITPYKVAGCADKTINFPQPGYETVVLEYEAVKG